MHGLDEETGLVHIFRVLAFCGPSRYASAACLRFPAFPRVYVFLVKVSFDAFRHFPTLAVFPVDTSSQGGQLGTAIDA